MTKAEVVEKIADKTGLEKPVVMAVVEAFMKVVRGNLSIGKNVYLRGFGTFFLKKRNQKKGRNISKNETIIIPEHYIVELKPAKDFAKHVKKNVTDGMIKLSNQKGE